MDSGKYLVLLLALACIAVFAAGCTSSKPATTTPATSAPAATVAKPAAPTASAVVAPSTTPECPDKNQKGVWDGDWDSRELAMAGNHDLSKAWANPDMPYGGLTVVKMTQKCWDVEGTISQKGTACEASFTGTISKNQLTGTWSGSKSCSDSEDGRKFALTMAADNKSWLGDLYDAKRDPANYPSNWAGRRVP